MAKATIKAIGGGTPFFGPIAYQVTSNGRVNTYSNNGLLISSKAVPAPAVVKPPTVAQVAAKAPTMTIPAPTPPRLIPTGLNVSLIPPVLVPLAPHPIDTTPTDAGFKPILVTPPISPVSTPATLPNDPTQNATARRSAIPGDTTSPTLYYPAPVASSGSSGGVVGTTPVAAAPTSTGIPALWLVGGAALLYLLVGRK